MEEEFEASINVTENLTPTTVPSKPPKSTSPSCLAINSENVACILPNTAPINKMQRPDKPEKPKKLSSSANACAQPLIPLTDVSPVATIETNNNLCYENQDSNSKVDKGSPQLSSIWTGMKNLPSYINSKVHAATVASGFSSSTKIFENILKSGHLYKMNREGTFEKNIVILMTDKLAYFKPSVGLVLGDDIKTLQRVELPSDYHCNQLFLTSTTTVYVFIFIRSFVNRLSDKVFPLLQAS